MGYGLYIPRTMHGEIVINGVQASTFKRSVDARVAHAGLAIMRFVFKWFGGYMTLFQGRRNFAVILPTGAANL